MQMHNNACRFAEIYHDRDVIKKEKSGEIALGFFFAVAVLAAMAGWFMVWRNKRGSYQAV